MIKTSKLRVYSDDRGSLAENTLQEVMANSEHFFISKSIPNIVRGNHYHKRKEEWFYIIKGKAEIAVEDIDTKERETITVSADDNILVKMEPLKAHAIKSIGDEEMILLALINEVFDQEDPDTYEYKVL